MTDEPIRPIKRLATRLTLAALLGVVACGESRSGQAWRERSDLESVWPAPDGRLLIAQLESGSVVAFDAENGNPRWDYQHFGAARHPVIEFPRPRLVCPPLHAPSDVAYLLFSDRLVNLSTRTGHVRWRRRIHSPYTRSTCPSATPDSGLVILARRGRGLAKIDTDGELEWTITLPDRAVASAGATVVQPSGDILLRAGNQVFRFNPEGELVFRGAPTAE
jgi:outer membrane protein assembly factor BamB